MKAFLQPIFKLIYSLPLGRSFTLRILLSDLEKTFLDFRKAGYFIETGWVNSFEKKLPVDKDKKPLPWLTSSAILFLKGRLKGAHSIFEYAVT